MADPSTADPTVRSSAEEGADENVADAEDALASCSHTECGNCVKHARCLKHSLPYGLFTCDDKRNVINSGIPTVGSVAIMNVGRWCHVGYVYQVDGSGDGAIIWLDEANYSAGKCTTTRHGTESELKIIGYFN